jgi:hypothetical protein
MVRPMQKRRAATALMREASVIAFAECGTRVSGRTTKFMIA